VQLRGIQIFADTLGGVNVVGRDRIKMTDVFAAAQCEQVNAPMFNIDGVHRAKLNKVWGAGSAVQTIPATIRVANISQFGRVRLTKSIVGNGEIGLLLENNGIGAVRVGGCAHQLQRARPRPAEHEPRRHRSQQDDQQLGVGHRARRHVERQPARPERDLGQPDRRERRGCAELLAQQRLHDGQRHDVSVSA
jgi:hypothetical protein